MAFEIVWTSRAIRGYQQIITYLEEHWSEKEIHRFVQQCHDFFELLKKHPDMLEKTQAHPNVHRGPINKHTILTYRVKPRKQQIELINIRAAKLNF